MVRTATSQLLESLGRWLATNSGESYRLDATVLRLSLLENYERWSVSVTDTELLTYLRHAGAMVGEGVAPANMDCYWADLSRRLSGAMSMWQGAGSVLFLTGSVPLFEPERDTKREQSRPSGTPPPGLRVVRSPRSDPPAG